MSSSASSDFFNLLTKSDLKSSEFRRKWEAIIWHYLYQCNFLIKIMNYFWKRSCYFYWKRSDVFFENISFLEIYSNLNLFDFQLKFYIFSLIDTQKKLKHTKIKKITEKVLKNKILYVFSTKNTFFIRVKQQNQWNMKNMILK